MFLLRSGVFYQSVAMSVRSAAMGQSQAAGPARLLAQFMAMSVSTDHHARTTIGVDDLCTTCFELSSDSSPDGQRRQTAIGDEDSDRCHGLDRIGCDEADASTPNHQAGVGRFDLGVAKGSVRCTTCSL